MNDLYRLARSKGADLTRVSEGLHALLTGHDPASIEQTRRLWSGLARLSSTRVGRQAVLAALTSSTIHLPDVNRNPALAPHVIHVLGAMETPVFQDALADLAVRLQLPASIAAHAVGELLTREGGWESLLTRANLVLDESQAGDAVPILIHFFAALSGAVKRTATLKGMEAGALEALVISGLRRAGLAVQPKQVGSMASAISDATERIIAADPRLLANGRVFAPLLAVRRVMSDLWPDVRRRAHKSFSRLFRYAAATVLVLDSAASPDKLLLDALEATGGRDATEQLAAQLPHSDRRIRAWLLRQEIVHGDSGAEAQLARIDSAIAELAVDVLVLRSATETSKEFEAVIERIGAICRSRDLYTYGVVGERILYDPSQHTLHDNVHPTSVVEVIAPGVIRRTEGKARIVKNALVIPPHEGRA